MKNLKYGVVSGITTKRILARLKYWGGMNADYSYYLDGAVMNYAAQRIKKLEAENRKLRAELKFFASELKRYEI